MAKKDREAEEKNIGKPAQDAFEAKKTDEVMVPPVEEVTPAVKPEKVKPVVEGPKPRPEQVKAAQYLEGLKAKPVEPPKPREDKRAGKKPPPVNQPEPRLTARQFVRARKQRWERCAGFLNEMKRAVGPTARLTMMEWQPLWDAFWTRPVGGLRRR